MKTTIFQWMAKFYDKERGWLASMAGLAVFSLLRPLYQLDETRYSQKAQEATIALGRLDVLVSLLRRRLL